jgi:hypothetical protein
MIFTAVLYFFFSKLNFTAPREGFLSSTRLKYGGVTFSMIRRCERLTKRLQKSKCDLEFLRCCLIYNLFPKFVRFKLSKSMIQSKQQLINIQRNCLQQEYHEHNKKCCKLEKEIDPIFEGLESKLEINDYLKIKKFMYDVARQEYDRITFTHKKKLEKLNNGPIGQQYDKMLTKLVHNHSSYQLTPAQERLLARGWQFCIEQKITNFVNVKTDIEMNALKLESFCIKPIFKIVCQNIHDVANKMMKVMKRKSIRNISDDEWKALKELKSNKDIIICKSDKGNAIVILNKSEYISKMNLVLNNRQFFRTDKCLLQEKEAEMNKFLRELERQKVISKELFWKLHSTSSNISTLYGQPKIHKTGLPMRPIISSIGAYNYNLSKYLANKLSQCKEPSPSYVKDAFEFVKMITKIKPDNNFKMCSFDVENLYTNIPVHECIELALDVMYKSKKPIDLRFDRKTMKKLFQLSVNSIPFRFFEDNYLQQDGVAMGSPLAPLLADIFMNKIEIKLKRFTTNKPLVWVRYVDDIFCLFTIDLIKIIEFQKRINCWHSNLKFTLEMEINQQIPFLDVMIIRSVDKFETTIYRKPTNTDLYMLYDSNQPRSYKLSLIKTLLIRIDRICSNNIHRSYEINRLKKIH